MTSTKIKFFASIEDVEDENDVVREAGLKVLFVSFTISVYFFRNQI